MTIEKLQKMLLEKKQKLKANYKVSALAIYAHSYQNTEASTY